MDPASLGAFRPGHGQPLNSSRQRCDPLLMSPFWPLMLFSTRESCIRDTHLSLFRAAPSAPFPVQQQVAMPESSPSPPSHLMPFLSLRMAGSTEVSVVDARYLLFKAISFARQQQTTMLQPMAMNHVKPS